MRKYNQLYKAKRRRTTGTGRCRYLKRVKRKEANGFMKGLAQAKGARNVISKSSTGASSVKK